MPGRPTSSLRAAGRVPTYKAHAPSSKSTKRASNRFSANFADDDDEEVPEVEKRGLKADDLASWAKTVGAGLEVPAGWSFKKDNDRTHQPDITNATAQPPKVSVIDIVELLIHY